MKHFHFYIVHVIVVNMFIGYSYTGFKSFKIGRKDSFDFTLPKTTQEPIEPKITNHDASVNIQDVLTAIGSSFRDIYFEQNFDVAMVGTDKDVHDYKMFLQKTSDKTLINSIKNQYEMYIKDLELLYTPASRIPKIIHQIWVGPYPFPQEARAWQQTWLNMHPDWEYKLWTNEDVDALAFDNKVFYNQATNWGEKADILRYEILYQFGGLYADIDQSCLKPFDILHHTCDFYTGIHALPLITIKSNNKLRIANGVIACSARHPIMHQMVVQIKQERKQGNLLSRTGPDYFTKVINQVLESSWQAGNIDIIFPANYFYPCAKRKNGTFKIETQDQVYVKPETLGIQYYTSYWVTPPRTS